MLPLKYRVAANIGFFLGPSHGLISGLFVKLLWKRAPLFLKVDADHNSVPLSESIQSFFQG